MPHVRKRPDGCFECVYACTFLRQTRGNPVCGGPRVAPGQTGRALLTKGYGMGECGLAKCPLLFDGCSIIAPYAKSEGR